VQNVKFLTMKHDGEREEFTVKFPYFLRISLFAKRNLFATLWLPNPPTTQAPCTHARTHTHMSKNRMTESEIWKQAEEKK